MAEGTRQPSLQRRAEGWKHHPTQHPHFGGDHCRLLWYDFWSRLGLLLFLCCCLIVAFVLFYRLCHHLPHDDHRHHHDNIKVQCPISSHNDKEKNSFGKNTKYKTSNMASFNFQWSQNISTRADKFFPFSVRNQQNKPNIHPPKGLIEILECIVDCVFSPISVFTSTSFINLPISLARAAASSNCFLFQLRFGA